MRAVNSAHTAASLVLLPLLVDTCLAWRRRRGGPGVNDKGLSRKHIIEGTQASLRRLQTDYVDGVPSPAATLWSLSNEMAPSHASLTRLASNLLRCPPARRQLLHFR